MPQVTVTIASRTYRMACGEGEEAHLEKLAALFDGKIEEMRGSFGEIGDMRLHVMAAITLEDEMHEMRKRMAAMEA
ncbi:MAG TPA: cell division protein ZapA, partial [Beijerinckiaceae bacterium]|nr:cell division protein ZapA [Beijerinckiaceae bacterium]